MWRKYVKVANGSLCQGESGRWNLVISERGKKKCYAMGTHNRTEAEAKRREFVERMKQRRIEEMAQIPLLDSWSLFEASPYAERLDANCIASRFRAWRDFAAWMHEKHPDVAELSQIGRAVVNEFVGSYGETHTSATTNNTIFLLRGVMGVMKEVAGLAQNPFDNVPQLQWDSHSRRSLTKDEISRLLAAAKVEGREYHLLFLLAAYAGLRLGECCNLKWENIDVSRCIIQFVPSKTRKFANGQLVTIPIHWKLLQALLGTPAEERAGAVLPELARSYAASWWGAKCTLKRIFREAGIQTSVKLEGRSHMTPEATFHSLRHSFVSFAANAGVPLESLRSIVGHKTTAMTRHYYHADEDALRQAVASVPVYDSQGNVVPPSTEPVFVTREMRETRLSDRLRDVEALFEQGLISEDECNDACMRIMAEA